MVPFPSSFALTGAILFTGEAFIEGKALLVENGLIADIVPEGRAPSSFDSFACEGGILAPGFIDCQVNGGGNVLFNNERTKEGVLAIAAAHRKTGTTRLLPTVITDTPEVTRGAIAAMRSARKEDSSILGIHIEGPHISREKKGIHREIFIRPLGEEDIKAAAPEKDETILVTLAPENAAPEQIKKLAAQGTIVSLGHTAASPDMVRAALAAGATGFTHLFNAMGPMSAREPGPAGVALDDRESWCSLVADGRHVAPEMIRLAHRAKSEDKLFFVSDALAPAGAEKPEAFLLNGETIYPKNGVCQNAQGCLAGAMMTLGEMVSHAVREMKMEPERVLRMASTIPAAFLKLDMSLGKLLPSYRADIVLLDHFFKAKKVWRDGKLMSSPLEGEEAKS